MAARWPSGRTPGGGLIGDLRHAGMAGIGPGTLTGSAPTLVFAAYSFGTTWILATLFAAASPDRNEI